MRSRIGSEQVPSRRLPVDDLATLLKVNSQLAASLELPVVLQTAIESAVEVLHLETGAIYLLDGDTLYLGATTPPLPPDLPDELRVADVNHHPHIRECLRTARPTLLQDARDADLTPEEAEVCLSRGLRSLLYVPLILKGDPVGAMIVGSVSTVVEFDDRDIDLCRTLSSPIALAVANARLYEDAQHSAEELAIAYDETLRGWSLALDMRDHDTGGHTERVVELALRLAREVGIPESDLVQVRRGALLHDIGKMVVPDAILHKPGPLTAEEWELMHAHPEKAREMLSGISYLAPALDIPYCHHERWDGSGYPRGLAGEDIPIAARVFAVVDVYDALVSDRPYRRAWTHDDAVAHIAEQSGRHFDPAVVKAFMTEAPHLAFVSDAP